MPRAKSTGRRLRRTEENRKLELEKPMLKLGYKEFVEETGQILRYASWKRDMKRKHSSGYMKARKALKELKRFGP